MRRLAIVAPGPSWVEAPWQDQGMEFWMINAMERHHPPRADRWIELHPLCIPGYPEHAEQVRFLASVQVPVVMQAHFAAVPTSYPYPRERVIAEFGRYFRCTAAWALALALHEGAGFRYREIGLYGIDFQPEYPDPQAPKQRANVEYYIGLARGRGVEVMIASGSHLCREEGLYGFEP